MNPRPSLPPDVSVPPWVRLCHTPCDCPLPVYCCVFCPRKRTVTHPEFPNHNACRTFCKPQEVLFSLPACNLATEGRSTQQRQTDRKVSQSARALPPAPSLNDRRWCGRTGALQEGMEFILGFRLMVGAMRGTYKTLFSFLALASCLQRTRAPCMCMYVCSKTRAFPSTPAFLSKIVEGSYCNDLFALPPLSGVF